MVEAVVYGNRPCWLSSRGYSYFLRVVVTITIYGPDYLITVSLRNKQPVSTSPDLEFHNEGVRVGRFGSFLDSLLAGSGIAFGDVFADRSLEQHRLLPHVPYLVDGRAGDDTSEKSAKPIESACPLPWRV